MPNDSIAKILLVALGVCLVCSLFVSTAAITLKERQEENKRLDRIKNILQAGGLYERGMDVGAAYKERITPLVIELSTGKTVPPEDLPEGMTAESFDLKRAAADPGVSEPIPAAQDIAGIKRKPRFMVVYEVMEGERLDQVILPVYGKGLWSTLYGFLALKQDLKEISGITFYEHGETPGLGGEVDNPRWKAQWSGKQAFDTQGNVIIEVLKGTVDPAREEARHQIDGLSGATLTTRGVDNLVEFWLGENGYGPFLTRLRNE